MGRTKRLRHAPAPMTRGRQSRGSARQRDRLRGAAWYLAERVAAVGAECGMLVGGVVDEGFSRRSLPRLLRKLEGGGQETNDAGWYQVQAAGD